MILLVWLLGLWIELLLCFVFISNHHCRLVLLSEFFFFLLLLFLLYHQRHDKYLDILFRPEKKWMRCYFHTLWTISKLTRTDLMMIMMISSVVFYGYYYDYVSEIMTSMKTFDYDDMSNIYVMFLLTRILLFV